MNIINKMQQHFNFILIIAFLFVECGTSAEIDCATRFEYNRCIRLADPLLREPHLVFPDNMADIELVCLTWNQFVDCLKRYTDECFTVQQRRQFNKAVENPIESVHQMCTQRPYQHEYLKYAGCIKSTVTQRAHCGNEYALLVNQVDQGTDSSAVITRATLCCSHDRFRRCVAAEARRLCDGGVSNGPAVRFAEQIIDKALSFLQDQCYNYIPNSGDCLSVSYKSADDQLALSTSPWYNTRFSSDWGTTGPTGTIPELQPIDTQPPNDYYSNTNTDTTNESPSTTTTTPTNQPSSPPVIVKEGTSTNLLGTRVRPSSYGRSSSWSDATSTSTTVEPAQRSDWATMSTWYVYQQRNEKSASSSSTAAASSTTTTTTTSTETWYPAAGSHLGGNEVDEPNQLGLAKPKQQHSSAHALHYHNLYIFILTFIIIALDRIQRC